MNIDMLLKQEQVFPKLTGLVHSLILQIVPTKISDLSFHWMKQTLNTDLQCLQEFLAKK